MSYSVGGHVKSVNSEKAGAWLTHFLDKLAALKGLIAIS